jgi:hypothetical protein
MAHSLLLNIPPACVIENGVRIAKRRKKLVAPRNMFRILLVLKDGWPKEDG